MTQGLDTISRVQFEHTGDFLSGRLRKHIRQDDREYIESLIDGQLSMPAGAALVERGQRIDLSCLLVSGFAFRMIETDKNRSIVGIHVPGDFIDLHGFALKRLDHSLIAVGDVQVGVVQHKTLERVMAERPRVTRAMWFATLLDAAIHRKWIQMLESLDAPQRIAHIYCELQTRLGFTGRAIDRALRVPFTQQDLADMCGVSVVHANRAVSKLRELKLAEIRRGTLYTNDWSALREYAEFDPSYLYGDGPLRLNEGWE